MTMERVGAEQADQGTDQQAAERRDALVGRIFQSVLGAMDLFNLYLGDRLACTGR